MAYIINIRHDIIGETLPVTLHYNDSSSNNADITLDITSDYADYPLTDWTDVDASKIQVVDNDIDRGAVIYHIKNSKSNIRAQS